MKKPKETLNQYKLPRLTNGQAIDIAFKILPSVTINTMIQKQYEIVKMLDVVWSFDHKSVLASIYERRL